MLIVPGLLVAGDELLAWLRAYAAAGGHLVIGPRTAYGDDEGRARTEVKPAHLADAAGVRYQEFSNLLQPVPVTPGERRLQPLGRSGGDRLERRPGQRGIQDRPRLRPSPLRPVPGRRLHRARRRPDHHGGHRAQRGSGRRSCSAGWHPGFTSAWDDASAVSHRQVGNQPARRADSRSAQLGMAAGLGRPSPADA